MTFLQHQDKTIISILEGENWGKGEIKGQIGEEITLGHTERLLNEFYSHRISPWELDPHPDWLLVNGNKISGNKIACDHNPKGCCGNSDGRWLLLKLGIVSKTLRKKSGRVGCDGCAFCPEENSLRFHFMFLHAFLSPFWHKAMYNYVNQLNGVRIGMDDVEAHTLIFVNLMIYIK